MFEEFFNTMVTMLMAKFILNDVPHAAGLSGNPHQGIKSTLLNEVTQFVNRNLNLSLKPTLEFEPQPQAEYVAVRVPGQERIIANPQYFPKDEAGQKTVLIHEISEIGYEKKGFEQPHSQASDFTNKHWEQVGGKNPEVIHKELVDKGYYHGSESPLNIERMLSGEYYEQITR